MTVSCRVLKLARQPSYRWRCAPVRDAHALRRGEVAIDTARNAVARRGEVAGCILHAHRAPSSAAGPWPASYSVMAWSDRWVPSAPRRRAPPWSRSGRCCRRTSSTSKLRLAIVVRIERKYHPQRAQDTLGGLTPIEFEAKASRAAYTGGLNRTCHQFVPHALPLSVLKREQDRIVAELNQATRRIDAHFGDYADARAHLDDALGLLANRADIYARCDDTNRHLCNQAFFTKVFIDEDNELRVGHNRPFEMLLDRRSTPTP